MLYGKRLQEIRKRIGLTQENSGKIINITKASYCQYESEYKILPTKHLNTLCNYYNISLDYIFEFTNKKQYNDTKENIDLKISGERLKELRKSHKLTQEKLANELNVARTIILEYEKGHFLISTHSLYTICKKYNISADYLLGKIDYIPKW